MTSPKDVSISHHNYDIVFKSLTHTFKDKALTFYGLDTAPVVHVEPTDIPQIKVDERRMDFVFYLADDTYLHLEFQTTAGIANLERFKVYDVALYEQKKKPVNTAIIYGAGISKAPQTLDHGSVKYFTQAVYMNEYDGDEIYRELLDKVEKCDALDDIDQLNLILLPLMKSKVDKSQRAIESVELAKNIKNEQQRTFLIGSLIGITDKFIDKEYIRKMMEVLKMTRVAQEIFAQGKEEGKIEGKIEGRSEGEAIGKLIKSKEIIRDYLDVKFGIESIELQEKVKELFHTDILNHVIKRIFNANALEQAKTIIDEAIKAQTKILGN